MSTAQPPAFACSLCESALNFGFDSLLMKFKRWLALVRDPL